MVQIHVRVMILGPGLWASICLGLLNRDALLKAIVHTTTT